MEYKGTPVLEDQALWDEVQRAREEEKALAAKLIWSENTQATPEEAAMMIDAARNRARAKGKPFQEILNEPKQFSGFDPESPRYQEVMAFGPGHPNYESIQRLVELAYNPKRKPTKTTHYYANERMGGPPHWAPALTDVQTQGAHTFGREQGYPKK